MTDDYLLDQYYNWMLDILDYNLPEHRCYELLLRELNNIEFYWSVTMDENRDIDAVEMRRDFIEECGFDISTDEWDDPRSVLEVLVAFSRKIEIMVTGEPGNDDLSRWFWIMVGNLGLLKYDNENFYRRKVDDIVDRWLARKITKTGKNGIFPLKKLASDQRDVEMWHQFHTYLSENERY